MQLTTFNYCKEAVASLLDSIYLVPWTRLLLSTCMWPGLSGLHGQRERCSVSTTIHVCNILTLFPNSEIKCTVTWHLYCYTWRYTFTNTPCSPLLWERPSLSPCSSDNYNYLIFLTVVQEGTISVTWTYHVFACFSSLWTYSAHILSCATTLHSL